MLILTIDANYSTRRIRRQVHGEDLKSVQEKQITIPVNIPFGLENYLLAGLPQDFDDLPSMFTDFPPLIPIHDPSKYDPNTASLPSLRDAAAETGNLRYWVITNETMWASQHRALDEFAELMWALFHSFAHAMSAASQTPLSILHDNSAACWHLARSFRRRIVLPELPCFHVESHALRPGQASLREALLFKSWAFLSPAKPDRDNITDDSTDNFQEEILYPFPDDLFWHFSDEGTWDEEGVPEWVVSSGKDDTNRQQVKVRHASTQVAL